MTYFSIRYTTNGDVSLCVPITYDVYCKKLKWHKQTPSLISLPMAANSGTKRHQISNYTLTSLNKGCTVDLMQDYSIVTTSYRFKYNSLGGLSYGEHICEMYPKENSG